MDLEEVMRTTFSCRDWTDEPVSDETLHHILDLARFAPTGGNRQGVRVIVLRDRDARAKLLPFLISAFNLYLAQRNAGYAPRNTIDVAPIDETAARAETADLGGQERLLNAPVILIFTVDLAVTASTDSELDRVGVISGASVYPFVWNTLLAARNAGLGGVITTAIADQEPAVQRLLGIPAQHAIAAMVPLGYPVRQLTKLSRLPVEELVTIDRFDGKRFVI